MPPPRPLAFLRGRNGFFPFWVRACFLGPPRLFATRRLGAGDFDVPSSVSTAALVRLYYSVYRVPRLGTTLGISMVASSM